MRPNIQKQVDDANHYSSSGSQNLYSTNAIAISFLVEVNTFALTLGIMFLAGEGRAITATSPNNSI